MNKTIFVFVFLLSLSTHVNALPQLVTTGDIRGEIKPCGCSEEGDLGGIERISTYFKQKSQQTSSWIWIDLGNFSAKATPQGTLKNKLYEKLYISNNLFAILPGPLEFSRGLLNFKDFKLPFVLTNSKTPIENSQKSRIYKNKVQFFGYLSPALLSQGTHQTKYLINLKNFIQIVKKIISKKVEKKVLLFRGSLKELSIIDKSGIFDHIIPANSAESEENQILTVKANNRSFLLPPIKGQGVLEQELGIVTGTHQSEKNIVWLSKEFKSDSEWKKDFDQYQNKVEELFFEFLNKEASVKDKTIYKGAQHCITCHQKEGKIWQESDHAKAWLTLERVQRTFDPDCIPCHSVGFGVGGFLSKELTPALASVQCENCHGVVAEHSDDDSYKKKRKKVNRATCKKCHKNSHSPGFSFKKYFSKIKH